MIFLKLQPNMAEFYLSIILLQLRLYAKFRSNGSTVVIPDKFEGKAILSTPNAILDIYHNSSKTAILLSLLFVIPILLCPFMIIYMKGARRQIRFYLRESNHHASLAALTSISLIFSLFVVGMDVAAVYFAYKENELITYVNFNPHNVIFSFIPVVLVIDLLALLFALVIIFTLACNFCICPSWCKPRKVAECCRCCCSIPATPPEASRPSESVWSNCKDTCCHGRKNCCKFDDATDCCFSLFLAAIFCFRKLKSSDDCQNGQDGKNGQGSGQNGQGGGQNEQGGSQNEQKVWLLTIVFVAPFIAFGTHFTYIVIAWIQYPDHAGAISIMYILTFLYLFITFRFLYLCLSDNMTWCKGTKIKKDDIERGIGSPAAETAEYEELERNNFKVWKVLLITTIGIAFCGVEIWLIAGLVTLPIAEVIEDAPTYIYAWF